MSSEAPLRAPPRCRRPLDHGAVRPPREVSPTRAEGLGVEEIRRRFCTAFVSVLAIGTPAAQASASSGEILRTQTGSGPVSVIEVARGLEHPWGLAFLPDGRMLVTERPGRLRIVDARGRLSAPIRGVPAVHAVGQGGLLDVVVAPDFARSRMLFLSYAEPSEKGGRTAIARAEFDGDALRNLRVIFRQQPDAEGGNHWGSRLAVDRSGLVFATLGDRFTLRDKAQDLGTHLGKVIRIRPDGSIPTDNPFVGRAGALPEIWSFGHRNPQGAALHPLTGQLWTHEHGPQGGDEVNLTLAGRNHGWPVITSGREYGSGWKIGEGTRRDDVEAPRWQWTPSIAPSGMAFYTGDRFPGWRGSLLVGALRGQMLVRLDMDGDRIVREERMLQELRERVRDVRQGPDGFVYLLTDQPDGRLLKLVPGGGAGQGGGSQ